MPKMLTWRRFFYSILFMVSAFFASAAIVAFKEQDMERVYPEGYKEIAHAIRKDQSELWGSDYNGWCVSMHDHEAVIFEINSSRFILKRVSVYLNCPNRIEFREFGFKKILDPPPFWWFLKDSLCFLRVFFDCFENRKAADDLLKCPLLCFSGVLTILLLPPEVLQHLAQSIALVRFLQTISYLILLGMNCYAVVSRSILQIHKLLSRKNNWR